MILFLFGGIIPAIFLVEIGRSWYPIRDRPETTAGWAGFLSIALGLLLTVAVLAITVFGESGSLLLLLLLPSICALFAESCLYLFGIAVSLISKRRMPGLHWHAALLLVIPLILAALGTLGDKSVLMMILGAGALLAFGWLVWDSPAKAFAYSYLPMLLLMLVAVWGMDTQSEYPFLPANLAPLARNLSWLAPGLGIVYSWMLLGRVVGGGQGFTARRLLTATLIVPILLLLAWLAVTASAWDVATDGLGGIFLLELSAVFGVAAAIHGSWRLSPKRSSSLFGFVALLLVLIAGANSFGTFGFDGEWGNVPRARTARRAERINQAILRFHQEQGSYPQALTDLTPGYLLYLPVPFIIPHQDWCYQGGPDYYRLGYVYRDYFSSPASVKVYDATGEPPDPSWTCEAEAAKYPAPPG